MKTLTHLRLVAAALLSTWLVAAAAADSVMFKFTDQRGDVVYSYTLPPGQARLGYQKVDVSTGQVVESVAPQLPPEELAEQLRREEALNACRAELARLHALYGSEQDIGHAEREALDSLERRIAQIQGNLALARQEQERLSARAADAERAGRPVSQSLLDKLQRSQSQIRTLMREVEQRRAEQNEARTRYARELQQFRDGDCGK